MLVGKNMSRLKKNMGDIGERVAEKYLLDLGYKIVARKVFIGGGEIDIVASIKDLIVFIEVKTRNSEVYVDLLDTMDNDKVETLEIACDEYISTKNLDDVDFRIDLVGVLMKNGLVKKIDHLKGVI